MSRRRGPLFAVAFAAMLLEVDGDQVGAAPVLSTVPGDVTLIQTILRVDPQRKHRIARIRRRMGKPRPLPRALTRRIPAGVVVLAAAGELGPGTFAASVVLIVRRTATASVAAGGADREARFARALAARFLGVTRPGRSVVQERAPNVLSTVPPRSLCDGALAPNLVAALTSPIVHAEGASIAPWTPSALLRGSLGLAFRACGLPLPLLLLPEEVDAVAREIDRIPGGTTSTTLPEDCHDSAQLEPMTLTDPAHSGCTELEWITPIPDCADDLAFELIDAASGQPVASPLFGHTTLVTYFFGLHPIRLVIRACNGEAGSPGAGTVTFYPVVHWGG